MQVERTSHGPTQAELGREAPRPMNPGPQARPTSRLNMLMASSERWAGTAFVLPAVLALLFLSIFPLLVSLYISVSRFKLVRGGFELNFVGLANYQKLLFGNDREHFLGVFAQSSPVTWALVGFVA